MLLMLILQVIIMLGFPVGLWLFLRRRLGATWGLIGTGALTFIASQIVHLPLNWALGLLGGGRGVALWPLPLMALIAGLSAGVCEEGARYLVLRFWRREARSWEQGMAFGAGHGGTEAILLSLLVVVNSISMITLRETGLEKMGLSGEMLEQAQAQVNAFWAMPWFMPLLGGLERVFAITIQIALSLLVIRALTQRNAGWLLIAVLAHALVDGITVFLSGLKWPPLALEGIVLIFALSGLALIMALRPRPTDVSRETPAA
ncbi:MAG: hypothetical protein B6I34_08190 [Anaerolineaceae bacterium 4572_32.1]|nr:MAG: hypothetical protein B6I34_08190 [Anaerolineaceae bacterium 4572_32.1]